MNRSDKLYDPSGGRYGTPVLFRTLHVRLFTVVALRATCSPQGRRIGACKATYRDPLQAFPPTEA
jgi:hypothetical protein